MIVRIRKMHECLGIAWTLDFEVNVLLRAQLQIYCNQKIFVDPVADDMFRQVVDEDTYYWHISFIDPASFAPRKFSDYLEKALRFDKRFREEVGRLRVYESKN